MVDGKKLRISRSKVCCAGAIRAIFRKTHSSSGEIPVCCFFCRAVGLNRDPSGAFADKELLQHYEKDCMGLHCKTTPKSSQTP